MFVQRDLISERIIDRLIDRNGKPHAFRLIRVDTAAANGVIEQAADC